MCQPDDDDDGDDDEDDDGDGDGDDDDGEEEGEDVAFGIQTNSKVIGGGEEDDDDDDDGDDDDDNDDDDDDDGDDDDDDDDDVDDYFIYFSRHLHLSTRASKAQIKMPTSCHHQNSMRCTSGGLTLGGRNPNEKLRALASLGIHERSRAIAEELTVAEPLAVGVGSDEASLLVAAVKGGVAQLWRCGGREEPTVAQPLEVVVATVALATLKGAVAQLRRAATPPAPPAAPPSPATPHLAPLAATPPPEHPLAATPPPAASVEILQTLAHARRRAYPIPPASMPMPSFAPA